MFGSEHGRASAQPGPDVLVLKTEEYFVQRSLDLMAAAACSALLVEGPADTLFMGSRGVAETP